MATPVSIDQIVLPGFDLRPICTLCRRPADVLGQWSPFRKHAICRTCNEADPFPESLVRFNEVKGELEINPDADLRLKEQRLDGEARNREACRKREYVTSSTPMVWGIRQISMPFCPRCGVVHDRRYSHVEDYQEYCQRCEDEQQVETLFQMKSILEQTVSSTEPEAILDYLYKRNPELFERNVLPDLWFMLGGTNVPEIEPT
jgi:hypothetical protein